MKSFSTNNPNIRIIKNELKCEYSIIYLDIVVGKTNSHIAAENIVDIINKVLEAQNNYQPF